MTALVCLGETREEERCLNTKKVLMRAKKTSIYTLSHMAGVFGDQRMFTRNNQEF